MDWIEPISSLPSGISMGAVAGTTDGGFGGFDVSSWEVWLKGDGEVNWDTVYMFGYKAIDELSQIGKAFTKSFYNMSDTKLWSYFDGCFEGGREGWSQVQIGADLDGAVIGAPGMHFSFQQIQHLWSQFVEYQLNHYPPYCELEKIVNLTTEACDHLDGRVDGVVARTDLMGTVTAEGVAVAREILNGAHDNLGRRIYVSYQPTAAFQDASAQWVEIGLNLLTNVSALSSFEGTTWPDLSVWHNAGGKVLHYHGESDPQVPTAGSVRYFESVRSVMYPGLFYNQSVVELNNWYRLFLIPGGAHCGANSLQPNVPWPETTLATLIDCVEKGIEPKTLNGTIQSTGAQQQICGWPPPSLDTWKYDLNAFKMPIL
ncbi:tannase and feruloyl esterase [Aspergillus japonicus CBS 114.51]|uniref:Carboxylic ester hydrolase n=1 Tax=Aspergillus japonicus CBS 114.51 TaxID=1448312 RepID=A0A8T8XGI0_ASPJA|nr:tannase and feruloyl esterase [Aspergillus japonicus CBS 114.51]RAH87407.1 tannase and feruloyl esterase [Aspergillus japonicus CBS 114.51]